MAEKFTSFTDSFMKGFSFVDTINANRRNEKRLEQRLAQQDSDRVHQRQRQNERDDQVREDRKVAAGERARITDEREKRRAGIALALDPESTEEQLIEAAQFSPEAMAEAKRRMGEARFKEAFKNVQTIPTGGAVTGVQSAGTPTVGAPETELPTGPTLSAAEETLPSDGATEAPSNDALSGFAPSRAVSDTIQEVPEELVEQADPEFQEKGFGGRLVEGITGNIQQATRAAGNVLDSFAGGSAPEGSVQRELQRPGERAAGAAFGGSHFISAEFVRQDSEDYISSSPQEREVIDARNEEIVVEQKKLAQNPSRNLLSRPITRQGAAQEGGELSRDAAQRAENQVNRTYTAFAGSEGGQLEEIARRNPSGAAIQYLNDRATLETVNPDLVPTVDKRMVPVFQQYQDELQDELEQMTPGSPEFSRQSARLANLQASTNVIAGQRPPAAEDANLKDGGLKPGDTARAEDVFDAIYDPNRPTVTNHTPGAVQAAATVAARISPKNRLNEKQIEGLAVLAEAGWISKPTAMSVMMTGAWPPGKDPNSIKNIKAANGVTWAITEGGGAFVIDGGKNNKPDPSPSREITEDQIGWAAQGYRMQNPNASEEQANTVGAFMTTYPGWVRSHYNVTSQEQMRQIGVMWGRAVQQSAKDRKEKEDDWIPWTNEKQSPKPEEIMFGNDDMREELATNFSLDVVNIPDPIDTSGVDFEKMRQGVREGQFGVQYVKYADILENDQLAVVIMRDAMMQQELEASRQQEQ